MTQQQAEELLDIAMFGEEPMRELARQQLIELFRLILPE